MEAERWLRTRLGQPWGYGRPGWHLECSAMSEKHLGKVFDIHGGGIDLLFPHHENEVAQSTCAHGTEIMANVWMHNGHLQVEGQKMSKSLGNFITMHDLLTNWHGLAGPARHCVSICCAPITGNRWIGRMRVWMKPIKRCGTGTAH